MFMTASDSTLISRALAGSQRSWVKLVQRHEKQVYNYCLRLTRNPGDALDLLQEVFLAVYRHLPSFQGQNDQQFRAWLMRIAVNKTMDLLRQRRRSPRLVTDATAEEAMLECEAPDLHDPDHAYAQSTTNAAIRGLLASLPPEQCIVVELKFFQHFTFAEISQQTGVPVNTLKSRLYAALQKLKERLEERHVM